jgi:hypothetical protein
MEAAVCPCCLLSNPPSVLRTGDEERRLRLGGPGEGDLSVDMVETESNDADRRRFASTLPSSESSSKSLFSALLASSFASSASAIPFLQPLSDLQLFQIVWLGDS